jgi:5-methylcytosine-specific restriction endonuclease McrA
VPQAEMPGAFPMLDASYHKFIKSERWKAVCEVYWRRKGRFCQACGATQNLHVHHMTYDRFGGREALSDLMGLCYTCHREVHALHKRGGRKDLRVVTLQYVLNKRRLNRNSR